MSRARKALGIKSPSASMRAAAAAKAESKSEAEALAGIVEQRQDIANAIRSLDPIRQAMVFEGLLSVLETSVIGAEEKLAVAAAFVLTAVLEQS